MNQKLNGWSLTEGQIPGERHTENPSFSDVVAALEALDDTIADPYLILDAAPSKPSYPNYMQVCANEGSYACEIRLWGELNLNYLHYHLLAPDESGSCGVIEKDRPEYMSGYNPDMMTIIAVLKAFTTNPNELPSIQQYLWLDMTAQTDS